MESYITYEVKTETDRVEYSAQQMCIRRRYQDFLWLKDKLETVHPGLEKMTPFSCLFRFLQNSRFLTKWIFYKVFDF